jgi:hypothetical protein
MSRWWFDFFAFGLFFPCLFVGVGICPRQGSNFLLSCQKKVTKEEALNTSHLAVPRGTSVAAACRRRACAVSRTPDVCPDHSTRRNAHPLGRMTLAQEERADALARIFHASTTVRVEVRVCGRFQGSTSAVAVIA